MKAKIRKFIEEQLDCAADKEWHWHWNKDKNHPIYYLYRDRFECNLTINPYLITVEIDDKNLKMTYENHVKGKKGNMSYNYHDYDFKILKLLIASGFELFNSLYVDDYSNEWWMILPKEEKNGQTD